MFPLREEVRNMSDGMTAHQTELLIEWLEAQGFTAEQIVDCLKAINK